MKLKKLGIAGIFVCLLCAFTPIFEKGSGILEHIWASNEQDLQITNTSSTKNETPRIVIDAGHGGYDSGSLSIQNDYEKDITLAISLITGELLTQQGYEVVYTRTSDTVTWSDDNLDDLQSRVAIGENAKADYYISIHTNSSDFDDGAYGFEAYLDYSNDTILAMAENIESNLLDLQYTSSRGLKSTKNTSLYVIDKNEVPALLLELGFITDSSDATYLLSEDGQQKIAEAIAQGIINSLS